MSVFDSVRGSYWFLPMMMALGAGAAAFAIVDLDRKVSKSAIEAIPWIADTRPDDARAVLSVIAGSMITVTGVVFSITVVSLTLASSQFGPRLLRSFLRDRSNQLAFGTFVATFLYSLIALRAVHHEDVPNLTVSVAVLLAMISVFVLIYFIHHTAKSIEASSVIAAVADEIDREIPRLFPSQLDDQATPSAPTQSVRGDSEREGTTVPAGSNGFVRLIDHQALLDLATEHRLFIDIHRRPGDFVSTAMSLGRVRTKSAVPDHLLDALRAAFVLGDHRTPVQDLRFLTGQLTEIAVRALSPGVNDPRTAADCVHRLGAVISGIANREMPHNTWFDEEGRYGLAMPSTSFEEITSTCFDPLRRYGAAHVLVVLAFLESIAGAGDCCSDAGRRENLANHAVEMFEAYLQGDPESARDVVLVREAKERAVLNLTRLHAMDE